ncbi:unnamed protein product [Amaranthus hypochondriacus]
MARVQCMINFAFLCTLLTCQMLSGEGKQLRSLDKVGINYAKSLSQKGNRFLSIQLHKSDHSENSPIKITTQQKSNNFPQPMTHNENFPSMKPTHSSPKNSHKVDSFWGNRVGSIKQSNCLGANCPDDFRPTAPGHSPGAGHPFVTNTQKFSKNQPAKNPKMWNGLVASENNFRRTAPGRSPGIEHAEDKRDSSTKNIETHNLIPSSPAPISFFSYSALGKTNYFQPTSHGRSPHSVHADTNNIGIQGVAYCLNEKCIDDFRPTTPGESPGAGHSLTSKSDRYTSLGDKHPSVAYPHARGIDDFRPTDPGHSPGAGHAGLTK